VEGWDKKRLRTAAFEPYPAPMTFSFRSQSMVKKVPEPGVIRTALVLVVMTPVAVLAGPGMLATLRAVCPFSFFALSATSARRARGTAASTTACAV
jgi:hypothetical protein